MTLVLKLMPAPRGCDPHRLGVPVLQERVGQGGAAASATPSSSSPHPVAFPVTTPEPLVLVTPPRCLTANRTQQGVLLSWLPPANHSFPIDRYVLEFRVGERWETLDDGIPGTEGDFFARDLSQVWSLAFAGSDRELLLESLGAQVSAGWLRTATLALLLSQGCCQGLGFWGYGSQGLQVQGQP